MQIEQSCVACVEEGLTCSRPRRRKESLEAKTVMVCLMRDGVCGRPVDIVELYRAGCCVG